MEFPAELEMAAFRPASGEYAWRRPDACRAVDALADAGLAVLGGELWMVRGEEIWATLPQRSGPPAVYHWSCDRRPAEPWVAYVARAAAEAVSAIEAFPREGEVATLPGADIYYNLAWESESEYEALRGRAV